MQWAASGGAARYNQILRVTNNKTFPMQRRARLPAAAPPAAQDEQGDLFKFLGGGGGVYSPRSSRAGPIYQARAVTATGLESRSAAPGTDSGPPAGPALTGGPTRDSESESLNFKSNLKLNQRPGL